MVKIFSSDLKDVLIVEPRIFEDERGFFMESYHRKKYQEAGLDRVFVQDNLSHSVQNVIRGLHYQLHHPQAKLIQVLRGVIFDVAVDIRQGSPAFGQWIGLLLSDRRHQHLFIPEGFAHGFCVLTERAEVMYKCTDFYDPDDEHGLRWDDPNLAIQWPIRNPVVSARDAELPFLSKVSKENLPVLSPPPSAREERRKQT
ncbi:MAG: dTDP-4-dehydrorhamnose 3,5-epimerase [bacterium]